MPLALCRPVPSRVRPCACRDRNRATCRSSTGPKRECAHLRICNRNRACQNLRGSSGRHPLYATLQGCIEAKCGNWHGAQRTCICIMPAHGRLPVHISHSSTPKAYTSTLLLRRPVVSSSGGMCVTVPKVPVLMASCESTLLSPKSADLQASAACDSSPPHHPRGAVDSSPNGMGRKMPNIPGCTLHLHEQACRCAVSGLSIGHINSRVLLHSAHLDL